VVLYLLYRSLQQQLQLQNLQQIFAHTADRPEPEAKDRFSWQMLLLLRCVAARPLPLDQGMERIPRTRVLASIMHGKLT
jgi:hypothetical protein